MQTQKAELFEQISAQGWSAAELEDWEFEWWADEIWLLESVWSPVGTRAYITFLVDPMVEDWQHRKKGEAVWAVEVSPSKPESRTSPTNSFSIRLNQGWQKELPAFLKHLSLLREKSKEA